MRRLLLISLLCTLAVLTVLAQAPWTAVTGVQADSSRYKSVHYLASGAIWIAGGGLPYAGNYGYISTDHGSTWTKFDLPATSGTTTPGISNIHARDASTALVGLNTGIIIRTTNAGAKWDTVFSYANGWMDGVMYVTQDVAVGFGDADGGGLMIARSTDGGATWTRATGLPGTLGEADRWIAYYTYGQAMDVYGNTIWLSLYDAAGVNPRLAKSTDAGVTWSEVEAVLPGGATYNYRFHAIAFKNEMIGYGICRGLSSTLSEYVIKTTDGGVTWSDTIRVEDVWPHNMAQPSNVKPIRGTNLVVAMGGSGASPYTPKTWLSKDEGATWTPLTTPGTQGFMMNADFISASQGIVLGTYGVSKLTSPLVGVDLEPAAVPEIYELSQNYPNPFNPVTNIRFSLPREGNVELKVFDMLGRAVATLVSGRQTAGEHTVQFDASALPSGVYHYTISAGDFTATKSLVVIK